MATTAQEALQAIGAEALTLVIAKPRDPANGDALVTVAIADGTFFSDPAAGTPNTSFHAVISDGSGITLGHFLTASGQVTGPSELTQGSLTVDITTDEQEAWKDLDWNGAAFEVYLGARRRADGQLMVFSEFDLILPGVIDRADALGDAQWEIAFTDQRAELEEPVTEKFYRGFGGGFLLPEGDFLSGSGNASVTIEPPFTIEMVGKLLAFQASAYGNVLRVGWGSFPARQGVILQIKSTGELAFAVDSVAAGVEGSDTFDSGHVVDLGEPFYGALVIEADGVTAKLYAGKDADDVLTVDEVTLDDALTSDDWSLLEVGGTNGPEFEAWEARIWSSAKTQEELEDLGDGPVTDAADRADLIESWRFSEGAEIGSGPEVVFSEKQLLDLVYSGTTPTWVSSYEGDDPDLFPGSPAGLTKARTWGPAKNVKLVQVDSQRPAFTWHHVDDAADLDLLVKQLRSGGAPMVREHAVESILDDQLVFDAATNTITAVGLGTIPRFEAFIPGQSKPARLGQRIVVSSTSLNNGTFRVAVDGVDATGRVLTVTGGSLQDESAAAGAKVESHPDDVQYTAYELVSPPRVELPDAPDADLTADFAPVVVGGFSFGLWSEIHAEISGKVVDTAAATWDPLLALHLPPDSKLTKKEALDRLARSAFGWWIEDPNDPDTHLLGTWKPPSGTPVAHIPVSRMVSVEPLRTVLPVGKFHVQHTPIWFQQSGDSLAGSVSAGDRRRWSEPHTVKTVVDRRIRDERFPISVEEPQLETLLSVSSEITTFVELAKPFHFKEPRWYRLVFSDLWALVFKLNDVVTVSWDDPELELDETLVRITGRELDLSAGTLELEVFRLKDEPT